MQHGDENANQTEQGARTTRSSSLLGPGTAGHTISGAAYRGSEVAANRGEPIPAEQGFTTQTGLGYVDREGVDLTEYPPSQDIDKPEGELPAERP